MSILAANTPTATSGSSLAILGTLITGAAAYGTYLLTKKRTESDGAGTLVEAGIRLAAFESAARKESDQKVHDCEEKVDELQATVTHMVTELEVHAADIRKCKQDREILMTLAHRSGLNVDGLD